MPSANNVRISASVGRKGVNRRDDVSTVQRLINDRLPTPLRPLDVDGQCGSLTIDAIEEIQRRYLHMKSPDGRVDPNGATFRVLTGGIAPRPPKPHPGSGATFPPDVIAAAQASHNSWKIPASVTLAQWALESNWGKAMPAGSNNPFGIKAAAGQPYVEATTREVIHGQSIMVVARFRRFASVNEAIDLHGQLLATARPYAHARTLANDPDAFADSLTGVYATDPNYGSVLKRIMKSHNLYQYD
jgi:Mannosyl-glycoprotein endo-beta-N-acetylglucosaminidase